MSTTYRTMALVGICIPQKKFEKKVRVRGCRHAEQDGKFCQRCGKRMWVEEVQSIEGFETVEHERGPDDTKFRGLLVVETYDGPYGDCYFLTAAPVAGYDDEDDDEKDPVIPNIDFAAAKEACKAALEPVGLWNEKKFGMWALLRVS